MTSLADRLHALLDKTSPENKKECASILRDTLDNIRLQSNVQHEFAYCRREIIKEKGHRAYELGQVFMNQDWHQFFSIFLF